MTSAFCLISRTVLSAVELACAGVYQRVVILVCKVLIDRFNDQNKILVNWHDYQYNKTNTISKPSEGIKANIPSIEKNYPS
ncbi:MAG: hypothetical protein H6620_05115 [Halobacteriovoraceae bacterium]|nr:hypothetical protein [Halobacteriovoraceae bacterium]